MVLYNLKIKIKLGNMVCKCQNSTLASLPNINIDIEHLIYKYLSNPITNAIVCGGLEPFDSWEDLYTLITHFRLITDDDIVIYTGYNP